MLLLGLDLETGAAFDTPPEDNFITEIGLVLWDTEFNQPVAMLSQLFTHDHPVSDEAAEYTNITNDLLARHGRPFDIRAIQAITNLIEKADYIVAHNGRNFDRPILAASYEKLGLHLPEKPWLDTQHDVDYPKPCKSRSLIYLAGFHGMVNPFAHRAITDVLTMLTILAKYDLKTVVANSQRKWFIVQAHVAYSERDKAKEFGFRWQSDRSKVYEKCWVKRVRDDEFVHLQQKCDFNFTILETLT